MLKNKFQLVYKTKNTPFFPICLIGKEYSRDLKEIISSKTLLKSSSSIIVVIKNGFSNWFFPTEYRQLGLKLWKKFLSSEKHFVNFLQQEKDISKKLLKEIQEPIEKLFLDKKLNQRGQDKLQKIFQYYARYGYFIDILGFTFQLYYVDNFRHKLEKSLPFNFSSAEKEKAFNLLLSTYRFSNYEKFLKEIYFFIKNKGNKKDLDKLKDKYYWLLHDYLGQIIDQDYLLKFIQKNKKDQGQKILQELIETQKRIKSLKSLRKKINFNFQSELDRIQRVLYIYNERKKKVLNQVNIYIRQLIKQRCSHCSLQRIHYIYQLDPSHILKFLRGEKIENLKKYNQEFVYEIKDGQIKSGPQKYLKLLKTDLNTPQVLKGNVAEPGHVRGVVDIVLNISQITKFKKGHILVAPFTTLSYLPIMRKAKAILTEVGGLTSHAAIVSRELRIPCIVGIKNLLSVLSDNNLLEVDANRGLIKILK